MNTKIEVSTDLSVGFYEEGARGVGEGTVCGRAVGEKRHVKTKGAFGLIISLRGTPGAPEGPWAFNFALPRCARRPCARSHDV